MSRPSPATANPQWRAETRQISRRARRGRTQGTERNDTRGRTDRRCPARARDQAHFETRIARHFRIGSRGLVAAAADRNWAVASDIAALLDRVCDSEKVRAGGPATTFFFRELATLIEAS
jgi:hypothetical protein